MGNIIQDIPKLYTAFAEWLSCLVFVLLCNRRWSKPITGTVLTISLVILGALQQWIGIGPIEFWIPDMVVVFFIMYGTMLLCCKATAIDICFYWAIAFMFAEFTASLEWQIFAFYAGSFGNSCLGSIIFVITFYGVFFCFIHIAKNTLVKRQKSSCNS